MECLSVEVSVGKFVSGKLFGEKPVPGDIQVDGVDHPVAISPRGWLGAITFIAIGLGEADDVQPVSRPFHAVLW